MDTRRISLLSSMVSKEFLIFVNFARAYERASLFVGSNEPQRWFAWLLGMETALAFQTTSFTTEKEHFREWVYQRHPELDEGLYRAGFEGLLSKALFSDLLTQYAKEELQLSEEQLSIYPHKID